MKLFTPQIREDTGAQERVRLWVNALRSGRYRQGRGQLKDIYHRDDEQTEYCCLGVACDLLPATIGLWDKDDPSVFFAGGVRADATPPHHVLDAYCLRMPAGDYIDDDGKHRSLVGLNDSTRIDFLGIADVVEKELQIALNS